MSDDTHSNENKGSSDWDERKLGLLWRKEGKSQRFYSGFVTMDKGTDKEKEVSIVIFLNKHKQKDNAPDLIIYESKEQKKALDHDELPETFI